MQVVVDNLLTNYQLQGRGKLVLFLHGWGDSSRGSLELQTKLAKQFTVLAPDLPGFGKTQAPHEAWDLDNYAAFLEHLLKKLDLEQPYAVIGHSNGGAIAIRSVALGRLKPQKLALLAAAGIRNSGSMRRGLLQLIAKVGKLATIGLPDRYRRALRNKLYKTAGSDILVVEGLQETFKKTVRQDVQTDASQITLPVLLIFGRDDRAVPPFMGARYHKLIKGSELRMVSAGHFVHLDQPELVATQLQEFLA